MQTEPYPVTYDVTYPDRELDRLTTFFRPIVLLPIALVLAAVCGGTYGAAAGGILVLGPALMIVGREKYPRWWQDWNRQLVAFALRVGVFAALQDDHYPSTDDPQAVRLEVPEVDAHAELNRWMPLVKWLLAIPHYAVLALLTIAAAFVVLYAWVAILATGRYPRWAFDFVTGVERWHVRVAAYAAMLVTDRYPPFRLSA